MNDAVAAGENVEDEKPPSDLPDPNESGNAAFLRKMAVSADEFFVGTILGIILTPIVMSTVYIPVGNKITVIRNSIRAKILAKQQMCMKIKSFERFVPDFDPIADAIPEWQIPRKYSLKTILITILTLQNMGVCQCSLLGMFEHTAPTTKFFSLISFVLFPCGYIIYVYITLCGAMVPTSKCRPIAVKYLNSIPASMKPDDLIFKHSIPPELSEPLVLEPPDIPDGTSPDEAKEIIQKHADITKAMLKQRKDAIKALGPAALKVTGEWIAKSETAKQWLNQYGDLATAYGPNGYITVTFAKAKRLMSISTLCILSTVPAYGPYQVKLLMAISSMELVMTVTMQPYRDRMRNVQVLATMATSALQLLAPILLLNGIIEDQTSALFMMVMNLTAVFIGVISDAASSIGPGVALVVLGLKEIIHIALLALVAAGYLKRKIMQVRISPPPPVWTIIRTPPPIVNLMGKVLKGHLLDHLTNVVLQVNPLLIAYGKTFASLAGAWLKEHGQKEMDTQFKAVMDKKLDQVSLVKFIDQFHRGACVHVFRLMQPNLKEVAQLCYDEATRYATIASETKRSIASGENIMASANLVVDAEMIKKLTTLTGALGPVIQDYAKKVIVAQVAWLKETGQKKIDEAKAKLEQLAEDADFAALKDADGNDVEGEGGPPSMELSLDMDYHRSGRFRCLPCRFTTFPWPCKTVLVPDRGPSCTAL